MRAIVVYYSYSGNTRKVAGALAGYLVEKAETEILELRAQDESGNFFAQCLRAIRHKKAKIESANLDLSPFDLVCLGSPVWAFGPAPAVNAFLEQCLDLEGKQVLLFTTYGSGTGNGRCLDYMQKALEKKGARDFKRFSIQQFKAKDKEFVLSRIREVI